MTNKRRRLVGVVVKQSGEKTVSVKVTRTTKHRLYRKVLRVSEHYLVHDENNDVNIGDEVVIVESRPISKLKRWCVENVSRASSVQKTATLEDSED